MNTEPIEFETAWCGEMKHTYLGALKGIEPFAGKEIQIAGPVAQDRWTQPTGKMIMQLLRDRGPMTQTQLSTACSRDNHDVRKALRRKAAKGEVILVQPTLLDLMTVHAGQLWRVA